MKFSPKKLKEGRERLKRLLPDAKAWAREAVRDPELRLEMSTRAGLLNAHMRFDNLRALIVYRTSAGWYADLLLKSTPVGVSDVLGTPTSMPHPDRAAAEEGAIDVLRTVCIQAMMNDGISGDTPREDVRLFTLFELEMPLPGEAVDQIAPVSAMLGQSVQDARAYALERMEETCNRLGIDATTTAEEMEAKSDDARMEVFTLACMLTTADCPSFPPPAWFDQPVLEDDDDGPVTGEAAQARPGRADRSSADVVFGRRTASPKPDRGDDTEPSARLGAGPRWS